jgi:hypothetical protein
MILDTYWELSASKKSIDLGRDAVIPSREEIQDLRFN